MPPQLPYELSDHIIDFLHDDKGSLSSCSLTCHAWLPAARHHLFNHVSVVGRLQPFSLFLDFAEGVRPYVRSLHWDGGHFYRLWDSVQLLSIFDMLPSLQRLRLERLYLASQELDTHEMTNNSAYRSLISLALDSVLVHSTHDLRRMVSSSSLRHLVVDHVATISEGVEDETVQPPHLTSLSITGPSDINVDLFNWLTMGPHARNIRKLHTIIRSKTDVSLAEHTQRTLGDTVQEFEMLVDADTNLHAVFRDQDFTLSVLSNIRSCSLEFRIPEMFVEQNRSLAWITALLCQLESPFLETLTLHAKADDMEDLRALDSECGFRGYATVSFDDYRALDWGEIERQVTKNVSLKELRVRGRGRTDYFMDHVKSLCPRLYPFIRPCPSRS